MLRPAPLEPGGQVVGHRRGSWSSTLRDDKGICIFLSPAICKAYDEDHPETSALFRGAGAAPPFRSRGRGVWRSRNPRCRCRSKELEEILGAPLVERGARQIRLTALGEEFALRAREILRGGGRVGRAGAGLVGAAVRAAADRGDPDRRALSAAAGDAVAGRAVSPSIDLRPREAVTPKLVRDLHEGRLDLAHGGAAGVRAVAGRTRAFRRGVPAGAPAVARPTCRSRRWRTCRPDAASCCWRRGTASAIRRLPSASCPARADGRDHGGLVAVDAGADGGRGDRRDADPGDGGARSNAGRPRWSCTACPSRARRARIGLVWRRSNPLSERYGELAEGLRAGLT